MKKAIFSFVFCLLIQLAQTQTVKLLTSGEKTSLRGLSVVDNKTVWVSGSNGKVGISENAGETWKWLNVKGFEKTDFRDIEAFDNRTAIIMGIDTPAVILKTVDGGENWKLVFKDTAAGMFLDAMEFWNIRAGIVIGDPVNGRMFIARTFDGGDTWQYVPESYRPGVAEGEACFASSGTNVRALNRSEAVFITGGKLSRLFIREKKISIPVLQGSESTGANSIAVKSSRIFIIAGGDFNKREDTIKNCAISKDGGKSWSNPEEPPHGYRSCIEYLGKKNWVSCGLNGVDFSGDEGMHWAWISKEGFHAVRKAKKGKAVYLSGGGGRIGKLIFE